MLFEQIPLCSENIYLEILHKYNTTTLYVHISEYILLSLCKTALLMCHTGM